MEGVRSEPFKGNSQVLMKFCKKQHDKSTSSEVDSALFRICLHKMKFNSQVENDG